MAREVTRRRRPSGPPNLRTQEGAGGPCCASCVNWQGGDGDAGLCFRSRGPKRAETTAFYKVCDDHLDRDEWRRLWGEELKRLETGREAPHA